MPFPTLPPSFLTFFAEDFIEQVRLSLADIEKALSSPEATALSAEGWRELTLKILNDLAQTLRHQEQQAVHKGGAFGEKEYKTLQYALVAYADEMFLNREWPGRALWEDRLLEMNFFNTHQAGERFFQTIEQWLQQGSQASWEIGRIYLWIVSLGFQGRFALPSSSSQDGQVLGAFPNSEAYGRHLSLALHPLAGGSSEHHLFPQAYQAVLDRGDRVLLPNPGRWKSFYAAFIGLLLVVSTYAVWRVTTPLRAQMTTLAPAMEGI